MLLLVKCTLTRRRPKERWYHKAMLDTRELYLDRTEARRWVHKGWDVVPTVGYTKLSPVDCALYTPVRLSDRLDTIKSEWP